MAIRDKNTLKTFFEKGDIPSQNQFEDLIDSFKHQNDTDTLVLTDQEIMSIANRLTSIDNASVEYEFDNMADNSLIKLDIAQENAENQEIEIRCNVYNSGIQQRQYFLGNEPFTVTIKEFKSEKLQANEYYSLDVTSRNNNKLLRLIGDKLPTTTLEGLEFGVIDSKSFLFTISKINLGKELNIVHTNIEFINKTDVLIEYKCQSAFWTDVYRTEDSVTSHYDEWDYLIFNYNADMTKADYTIACKVYDRETKKLLVANYFLPGGNYRNFSNGVNATKVRNVIIECTKE
jgi:hypothetical protein